MSKIIAVNSGSSSLKFQLYKMPEEIVITSGSAERIGLESGVFSIVVNGEKKVFNLPIENHQVAVDLLIEKLLAFKIIESLDEIKAAGHRIVQGGPYFDGSVEVDDDVVAKVEELCSLAPLHNHAHLVCYRAFKHDLPNIRHVFVFDTAFHQTISEENYIYPVPYEWYEKYGIRKYGAHGTSHMYIMKQTAKLLNKPVEDLNIISCHLGNGASISAIKHGKCIDTSMGLSPLGGIMMGTRCGDIDPTVVYYMEQKLNCTPEEMDTYLNKKSGMLGISGISSDNRDVENAADKGDKRAILTTHIYANRVAKMIGSYFVELGHVDAISFAGGLGEHACQMRERVLKMLEEPLGVRGDYVKNSECHSEMELSLEDSKVKVFVTPTNEELMIVRDTARILGF